MNIIILDRDDQSGGLIEYRGETLGVGHASQNMTLKLRPEWF